MIGPVLMSLFMLCGEGQSFAIRATISPPPTQLYVRRSITQLYAETSPAENPGSNNNVATPTLRPVARVEKFARLPVWPVWNGVLIWLISRLFGDAVGAQLEHRITGRVCPNFLNPQKTSPFVLLVHHCHSFAKLDPLRYLQRTFFPEGFPAHPHRGFTTITYILHGGFVHRDSEGIKQVYGSNHGGNDVQWLFTGSGLQHEEMFDIDDTTTSWNSRQELYQIWLNVPAKYKMNPPQIALLGPGNKSSPVVETSPNSFTRVIAGTFQGVSSAAPAMSEVAVFHVSLSSEAVWKYRFPNDSFETAFLYVRSGSLKVLRDDSPASSLSTEVPVHHTAYFEATGDTIQIQAGLVGGADFLFLAGAPLGEPCVASGSMVMNTNREIQVANDDYARGLFGQPWSHALTDSEWKDHLARFGPRGRF